MSLAADGIFKIVRRTEWQRTLAAGILDGSEHDRRDGFIHLATADQVAGVLERYFSGERDLLLIRVDPSMLVDLRWETGRSGVFPHHYGPICLSALKVLCVVQP